MNGWVVFFVALIVAQRVPILEAVTATVYLDVDRTLNIMNRNYASFNIDSSYNRAFFHINFTNPNLRAVASSLRPATLRFGGTGNDLLTYGTISHPCDSALLDSCTTTSSTSKKDACCMNVTHWNHFSQFIDDIGADLLFGVSFDMISACEEGSIYEWSDANVREWLLEVALSEHHLGHFYGFELGNEVNNNGDICNLTAKQQARAFSKFKYLLEEIYPDPNVRPRLVGPDTGYKNAESWLVEFLGNASSLEVYLHACTHHVYPGVNLHNWNLSDTLDRIRGGDIEWYSSTIREHAPWAEMWAGENGPVGGGEDGTCDASSGLSACGTFATVPWYADDMALRAQNGFHQFQRQDLLGARYGLVGIEHDDEFLDGNSAVVLSPNFWVNYFWKRTVGNRVIDATVQGTISDDDYHVYGDEYANASSTIRAYGFMGEPPSPWPAVSAHDCSGSYGSCATLLLVNLGVQSSDIQIKSTLGDAKRTISWSLSHGENGVNSTDVDVNGVPMIRVVSNGSFPSSTLPVEGNTRDGAGLTIPPQSVSFVVVWFL